MNKVVKNLIIFYLPIFLLSIYIVFLGQIGFTSDDDAAAYTSSFLNNNSVYEASRDIANSTGRFYQEIFYTITQMPYQVSNTNLYMSIGVSRSIQISTFYLAIYAFVYTVFGRKILALFVPLSIFTIDITGWYNALISYPFWISLGFSSSFIAALYLHKYLETQNKLNAILFIFFSTIGLISYESNILNFILYIFIALKFSQFNWVAFKDTILHSKIVIMIYTLISSLYLAVYFFYKAHAENNYSGVKLANFDLDSIIPSLMRESLRHSSIKVFFANNLYELNTNLIQFIAVNKLLFFLSFFLGSIIFILLNFNLNSLQYRLNSKHLSMFLSLMCLLIFPSILLSITTKYQDSKSISPYTTSLQSFVFLNIFLSYSLMFIYKLQLKHIISKYSIFFFKYLLTLLLVTSSTIQLNSNILFLQEKLPVRQVWDLLSVNAFKINEISESNSVRSFSIPHITRTGSYKFWGYFLNSPDKKILMTPAEQDDYLRLEPLMTDCGYVLILSSASKVEDIITNESCDPKIIFTSTLTYQFEAKYVGLLRNQLGNSLEVI